MWKTLDTAVSFQQRTEFYFGGIIGAQQKFSKLLCKHFQVHLIY